MTYTQTPATLYTASELEQIDENELVNRFQSGDTEAFNPLVLKYQKKIYSLMYQRVRDQENCERPLPRSFSKSIQSTSQLQRWFGVL